MKMGTVDVERYTGPCLITTAVRPKPKPRPGVANNDSSSALTSSSNGADCDNKHVSSGGGSNGGPISHHHQHHYPQLPINDPRNWAGAPLLSMAASIRKTKNGGGNNGAGCGGGGGGVNKNWHPPPVYLPAPIMHPATAMEGYAPHSSHLQGAPLIRVPRQQQQQQQQQSFHKKNNNMPVVVHGPSSMAAVSARRPLVYHQPTMLTPTPVTPPSPLPVAALLSQQSTGLSAVVTPMEMTSENGDAGSSSGCPSSSSDTCSVTSDEGLASGGSDSSLPRIIKPRKRRKKPGQESSSLLFHHHHHQRVATKGHHNNNGGGGIVAQDLTGSTALSELDDLLSNQGDSLAQLFRHTSLLSPKTGCSSSSSSSTTSSSSSGAATTTTTSGSDNCIVPSAQSPPLWPGQSCVEDDIWSSGCWHSLSPVWSPSGSSSGHPSPSSSSSSCWPDQRVIRRPDRQRNNGGQFQVQTSPTSVPYLDLPTSSFLTGMPELMQQQQQQQQQQPQHFQPEEDHRRHNLLGNDLQLHLDSPPPPLGHYLQVSSQLIASPFNGHRDIEIRFFSSTAQATHNNNNNNTVTTAIEEMGDVVVVAGPEQLLNNNNNSREHSVSSSPDFPR